MNNGCFQLDMMGRIDCCYKQWWDSNGEKFIALEHLDQHEVFGASNRTKSRKLGCVVWLCHANCHIFGAESVHGCPDSDFAKQLKIDCQKWCMKEYNWTIDDFRNEFGRNYI